ncbi:CYTH and CHAD domain-containing protein [Nocardia spumae]|uniref:CYTH and CHAD domain-containing protein n=1 Tax=Nocardia spumae TaxID=2887190 RepID=UPI001D153E40|nr:CYTH and CHAD domain-containing protein [Nocardia spumae]
MATHVNERERKYRLPATGGVPLDDMPGMTLDPSSEEQGLDAVYHDTADLRLAHKGITLRRRTGGDDAGWHLKLPLGDDTREEIRLPLGGKSAPRELTDMLTGITRGQAVAPVAHIRTKRRLWRLLDDQGAVAAEVVADHVSGQTLGESSTVMSWEEIEVELAGGGAEVFDTVETRLGKPSDAPPKALHVLGVGVEPRTPERGVRAYMRKQADRMVEHDILIRRRRPDSIHQMRVAGRRLRSVLQAFDGPRDLRNELKWLSGVLGDMRDLEVLHDHLVEQVRALPDELVLGEVRRRLTESFAVRRSAARADMLEALNSERYFALLDRLETGHRLPLKRKNAKALRKARRRVDRAVGNIGTLGTDRGLHEVRKAAKRTRYTAEATGAKKQARRMKTLQKSLGVHQDAVVARAELRTLGVQAHLAGENAFTYGVLYDKENQRAEKVRRSLRL